MMNSKQGLPSSTVRAEAGVDRAEAALRDEPPRQNSAD